MVLRISITAAFDAEVDADEVIDLGECISSAVDTLRGLGAARVDSATYDHNLSIEEFMNESNGIGEFEFTIPAPTKHKIIFD